MLETAWLLVAGDFDDRICWMSGCHRVMISCPFITRCTLSYKCMVHRWLRQIDFSNLSDNEAFEDIVLYLQDDVHGFILISC